MFISEFIIFLKSKSHILCTRIKKEKIKGDFKTDLISNIRYLIVQRKRN